MDMDELPQPAPMPSRPMSPWLVLASLTGLWGNICRSVTFACDEMAACLAGHHHWRQQQVTDLTVVDSFREQLKTL